MKKLLTYSSLLLLICSLFSCMQYKDVEVVKVVEFGVKNISLKGVEVGVAMQIKNPNKYDISIVDSDLTLFAEGEKVGIARLKEKVKLKKKSNKIYHFTIQTSAKDILSGAFPVLMGVLTKDTINMHVQGDIKAKAKGLSKRFPVDVKKRVKI